MMERLTILTGREGLTFAKTHAQTADGWTTKQYDHVKWVNVETLALENLDELSAVLMWLEAEPTKCVIRGRLIDPTQTTNIRRLSSDKDDAVATFEDQPSRIIMLDVDKLEAPADLTMAQRVARVIASLPAAFHDADFHLQWSSSADVYGWEVLKAHCWFWLSAPVTTETLKARSKAEGWAVDQAVFKVVQPHYTSAPVFKGAVDLLLGKRSGMIRRKHRAVRLPFWSPPPPQMNKPPVPPSYRHDDPDYQRRVQAWMTKIIDNLCQGIITAANGCQNNAVNYGALTLGRLVGGSLLLESEATAILKAAASAGNHPRDRAAATIKSGLAAGRRKPLFGPPD